ncbi:T7SS effector LXG polymorphic toxin [Oceanobacillus jeddahense]|uniref:LXG domain-containing protein n=1 Tax=Oceanobacillus jeddahense TaxID=1462527 RepID=A0ABY5K3B8_9BACI|nr:T7SS effector LXG polymorphic toxin [Oceanobacillus jeddahense]UUI05214.1 LXG domain-containing protein [Oceanobacillus jeddahense]
MQEASTNFRSQLDKVVEHIEAVNGMSSFSGKAAKEAKQYFSELHVTLLESFKGLFDDLEANLEQHLEEFQSEVDVSETAIIQSNYLQDIQEDVNELYEDLVTQDETIHDTINDVSDISSATPPSFSDVDEYKNKAIKKLKEVDEDLASFTGKGDETDVEAIMSKIETAMNSAQTSDGQARFADFERASQGSDLRKLQEYNERKQEEQMEKAKDARDSVLRDQDESSARDVVNKAYQEFEDGDISYDQYTAIVDSVKNTSEHIGEEGLKGNATETFITYLENHDMLDQYMVEHLDDRSNYYLDQAKEDYKSKDIDKVTYEFIRFGIIQEGTSFIKNASDEKLPSSVS